MFDLHEEPKKNEETVIITKEEEKLPEIDCQIKNFVDNFWKSKKNHHSILLPQFFAIKKYKLITKIISNFANQKTHSLESILDHPDVFLLKPNEKQTIGREDADKSISFCQKTPLYLNGKFIIIDNANLISRQAANCLLKTIEEPPNKTQIFILYSNKNAILETIKSRSILQQFDFEPNNVSFIAELSQKKETKLSSFDDFLLDFNFEECKNAILLCKQNFTQANFQKCLNLFEISEKGFFLSLEFLGFVKKTCKGKFQLYSYNLNKKLFLFNLLKSL